MHVAVVTSLFPDRVRPREGVFAERRWAAVAALGHRVSVVRPVPFAPPWLGGERAEFRSMASRELRGDLDVRRPRYLHVGPWPRWSLGAFARAARGAVHALEAEHGPADVVVADYAWPAAVLGPWARGRSLGFVISGRGSDILQVAEDPRLSARLRAELAAAEARVAVSRDLALSMDRMAGSGRTVLVPNGVDAARFFPRDRARARAELVRAGALSREASDAAVPLVLVVGHLIERKDPLLALAAFAKGAPRNAHIAFVGKGPLGAALAARADELGLAPRCHWVPDADADELALWYAASNVLLLTSSREGRPNVVLEALASGRPVVATEAGGTAELLESLPQCLVRGRSENDVAERLAAVLADPPAPDLCAQAVAPFTWERSAAELVDVLARAAERAHTRGAPVPTP